MTKKIKVSKKYVMENFKNVICVGYCGLQNTLDCQYPYYYTAGVYGWNSDVYYVGNNTVIVTGYRPFGNIRPTYELTKRYEKEATKIITKYRFDYNNLKNALDQLTDDFINDVLLDQ